MPGKAKNAENRRYARETAEAAEELGMLSTVEQIAKVNHHRSILHGSKAKIWQKYIFKNCGKRQVAIEQDVTMYNLIGQTRTFFVSEGDADNKVYVSLKRVLELWISLIVAEKLHFVFQHEDCKGVGALKNQGCSPAEVFRTYINVHKSHAGIKTWKKENMDNVRYALYQVVLKAREEASAGERAGRRPIENEDTDMHDLSVKFEVSDAPEDLYRASPRPATRSSRNILRSDEMTASYTYFSSTPSPAVSRFGNARYALRSNPQPVIDGGSCLDRLPAKIQQFRTELKEVEASLAQKQKLLEQAEKAAEQEKTAFRNLERDRQLADVDILDRREPEEWTPAALRRQANEIEKLAALKRTSLLAISKLVEKERAAKSELKEAEEYVKKYQERIEKFNRLMELARELDED